VKHLKGASLGLALALHTNIRLGWKGLLRTNTLAYYDHFQIMKKEKFYNIDTGVDVKKRYFFATVKQKC
jgi:hypothetical protein